MKNVNLKNLVVLNAILAGAMNSVQIIEKLNDGEWGSKQVAGAIRNLRNNNLVKGSTDAVKITAAGKRFAEQAAQPNDDVAGGKTVQPIETTESKAHKRTTKIAKALTLFDRHNGKGRQVVLAKFQSDLGMTEGGASTYYQLCRRERGLEGRAANA